MTEDFRIKPYLSPLDEPKRILDEVWGHLTCKTPKPTIKLRRQYCTALYWPDSCCKGFDFIAMECDSSGYGYGICLNPDCPHGDEIQGFQLEDNEEAYELDEEYSALFEE